MRFKKHKFSLIIVDIIFPCFALATNKKLPTAVLLRFVSEWCHGRDSQLWCEVRVFYSPVSHPKTTNGIRRD